MRAQENGWAYLTSGLENAATSFTQIGLAIDACLLVGLAKMGPDRGLGNAKSLGDLGNFADFDNCKQHPQFHRGELIGLCRRLSSYLRNVA
jgi:hypothetical protein